MGGRTERWIVALMDALEKNVDEKTIAKVLEHCGRQCQTQSFIRKARNVYQKSKSVKDFLEKFARIYKHLHIEGNEIYIVYPKCYCSQINKVPKGKLSKIYCNCSRGWVKALFEGATGKPVEVAKEKSIVDGDSECRFRVLL